MIFRSFLVLILTVILRREITSFFLSVNFDLNRIYFLILDFVFRRWLNLFTFSFFFVIFSFYRSEGFPEVKSFSLEDANSRSFITRSSCFFTVRLTICTWESNIFALPCVSLFVRLWVKLPFWKMDWEDVIAGFDEDLFD